ncbi:MAG: EAL domain-containing protein [Gammaproteobacteria bacterium]|nr:EAL domain-containing protein [Gammaproteobacteria bacterium]
MRFGRVRTRIIFFFVLFLALVQIVAFVVVNAANSANARARLDSELLIGERVFQRQLEQNREQLTQAARVLAADFGFRQAVATRDVATIESVLANHGARVDARVMTLVALDGTVMANTARPAAQGERFAFHGLLQQARDSGAAADIVMHDDRVQQLVVVPILAPLPIAWAALGFEVDDRFASDLKSLTTLDVSMLARGTDGQWRVPASSLSAGARRSLLAPARDTTGESRSVLLDGEPFRTRDLALGEHAPGEIYAVLQRPTASALVGFEQLSRTLVVLGLLSIVVSIIGSALIASGITRPLAQLARDARRLAAGDYSHDVRVKRSDEIGTLAGSLDRMRQDIATREHEILRLAYRDTLTDLPNRAMFNARLRERLADDNAKPFSVLVMDLDRFKQVNDTLGHEAGDQLLCGVSQRLQALLPEGATMARLGGDEFAVLLPEAAPEQAQHTAGSLLSALEHPLSVAGQPLDVGVSIGIASYPAHGEDAGTLLRHVDVAMYAAKTRRAGFAHYDPAHETAREDHLTLLGELRRAVETDQLCLHYQPKLALANGSIGAVEALLRWEHPERGPVSPAQFIPFAEHTGYVKVLTRWVLREAVRQAAAWHRQGLQLRVAVNISARDLLVRELPGVVAELLDRHALPAGLLCLEVTESGFMEDPEQALEILDELSALGVGLAIDDYGMGYSSLSYLMRLPIDELKIDRSFVDGMHESPKLATIVRSTIELGHSLGLKVIAEGIECSEELAMLEAMRCDQAQGYHISRPLPAAAFAAWLAAGDWPQLPRGDADEFTLASLG